MENQNNQKIDLSEINIENQTSPQVGQGPMRAPSGQGPMKSKKSKGFGSYILIFLIIAAVVILAVFYFKKPVPEAGLSDQEKEDILEQLREASANVPPLTEEERATIVEQLQKAQEEVPTLTEEEKEAILEGLRQ